MQGFFLWFNGKFSFFDRFVNDNCWLFRLVFLKWNIINKLIIAIIVNGRTNDNNASDKNQFKCNSSWQLS